MRCTEAAPHRLPLHSGRLCIVEASSLYHSPCGCSNSTSNVTVIHDVQCCLLEAAALLLDARSRTAVARTMQSRSLGARLLRLVAAAISAVLLLCRRPCRDAHPSGALLRRCRALLTIGHVAGCHEQKYSVAILCKQARRQHPDYPALRNFKPCAESEH